MSCPGCLHDGEYIACRAIGCDWFLAALTIGRVVVKFVVVATAILLVVGYLANLGARERGTVIDTFWELDDRSVALAAPAAR